MSGRVTIKWTPAAKAHVCALYAEGRMSGTEIAALIRETHGLQVSKSAVIGVTFRAGLSDPGELGRSLTAARAVLDARPGNPIPHEERLRRRRKARSRIAYARAKPVRPATPRPRPVAKAAAAPKPKPAPRVAATGIPVSLQIPIWEVQSGQCRFIADDPKGGASTYCGHQTQHGSVWCPGHFRMCTVPSRRPVNAWIPEHRRAA